MKIIIRADASLHIGSGHVMRCLTLADLLKQNGHEISFICREHDGNLADVITQKGFDNYLLPKKHYQDFAKNYAHSEWLGVSEADDFAECEPILDKLRPNWLIIDHYAIANNWESLAKKLLPNVKILAIDDLADRPHDCEILLDQTYGRQIQDYQPLVPTSCQLLVGTRYALLRDEFRQWREISLNRRQSANFAVKQILVNLGGVDKDNITLNVLQCLQSFIHTTKKDVTVTVVMGKTAPHIANVQAFARQANFACEVIVGANNMAELMANADLAIGASGSTTWERCCLGLPSVLLVLADNQITVANNLAKKNVATVINDLSKLNEQLTQILTDLPKQIKQLSQKSQQLVDGLGASRVVNQLEFVQKYPFATIRPATTADTKMIWQWRNHPNVRAWMFGQDEIALNEHEKWFNKQLSSPNVHLMIFNVDNQPMGVINVTRITLDRYQTLNQSKLNTKEKSASWGFYLSPESAKGQGLGFALGVLAICHIFNTTDIDKITAQVLDYNTASLALHRKLGFKQTGVLKQHFGVGDKLYDVVAFELSAENFLY